MGPGSSNLIDPWSLSDEELRGFFRSSRTPRPPRKPPGFCDASFAGYLRHEDDDEELGSEPE